MDRDSSKNHKDREHTHRSSKYRDTEDDNSHHSKHDKHDKYRSRDDRDDRHRRSQREYSQDREGYHREPKSEREGSKDRAYDRHKRDKSYEREREGSRDRGYEREKSFELRDGREGSRDRGAREESMDRHSHKRKERGDSEDRHDGEDKRVKVSNERKRRFEDRADDVKEVNGVEREQRREKRRFEDGLNDSGANRKERRRFGDRVKEEDMEFEEQEKRGFDEKKMVKKEAKIELFDRRSGSTVNGDGLEPLDTPSRTMPETPSHPPSAKVPSISTTNENKGVSINRSHEVPGKSSTDGTASDAAKSGGLSLDALAKAKRALQMQKVLSEKLKKIPLLNKGVGSSSADAQQVGSKESLKTAAVNVPHLEGLTAPKFEAVKRAQELAAKMGFRQDPEFAPLINMFPGQMQPEVTVQPKPAKAPVLRLDALGREVDEHGNVVNMPKLNTLSTLKVNINKQKKDAFQILKPELEVDPEKNPHFDARMGIDKNKLLRPKRMTFQFVEEGKWSKDAEIIKLKSQFGEAQAKELRVKQAQLAKAKAEPDINPNLIEVSERIITKEKPKEAIPEIDFWDVPLLQGGTYDDLTDGNIGEDKLRMEKLTIYIEHPRPIEPPAEPAPPPPQPLKLTKKEQKKLRTQRRLAREKDRQEMIRQGLIEPPKAKVKMSNLMKVLGSEATQDPTRLEMEIRSAAAEREQAHVDRNTARKLTPAERREKKERKLFDDPNTLETIVSVYKINDLSHPQTRFKVDVNAQENRLTGCAVISDGISVVVVEGGSKSIKRYQKLMLRRINWAAAVKAEDEDEDDDEEKPLNKCLLVWQGSVAKPNYNRFFVHECRSEAAARKVFSDAGVGHYFDLALNFSEDQM